MRRAGHAGEHIDRNVVWFEPGAEYAQAVANLVPGPLTIEGGTELLDLATLKIPCGCIRGRTVSIRDCYLRIESSDGDDPADVQSSPTEIREVGLTPSSKRLLARMLEQSAAADEKGGAS